VLGGKEFFLMNKMSPNSHINDLIDQLKRLEPAERDRVLAELMQESTLTLVIGGSGTTKFKVITQRQTMALLSIVIDQVSFDEDRRYS
jgi:4-diphosphocytidyl-2C-methyl-D-erythritol kinase